MSETFEREKEWTREMHNEWSAIIHRTLKDVETTFGRLDVDVPEDIPIQVPITKEPIRKIRDLATRKLKLNLG
jgi:hypothetical protein